MAQQISAKWMDLYTAAYLERDPVLLIQRIREAEDAILERQRQVSAEQEDPAERKSLEYSLEDLRLLREKEQGTQPAL